MQHRKTKLRKVPASSTKRKRPSPAGHRSLRHSSLSAREQATRERALALLSELRRGEGSYRQLLRKHHLDTRTAHRYLGRDLLGGVGGKPVRASKADRRVRDLLFPTAFGDVPIRTRSSRDATKLSEFLIDRNRLLGKKLTPEDFEAKWRGVRVAGQELLADVAEIFRMENAGVLKVESLYASTVGAR